MEVAMSDGWSSDWFQDEFSNDDRDYSSCLHRHVVPVTTGSRRFSQGEVYDDIKVFYQCKDCMEYVSEVEVRGAWEGNPLKYLDLPTGENNENK
jgi:hypothetical protein